MHAPREPSAMQACWPGPELESSRACIELGLKRMWKRCGQPPGSNIQEKERIPGGFDGYFSCSHREAAWTDQEAGLCRNQKAIRQSAHAGESRLLAAARGVRTFHLQDSQAR